MKNAKNIVLEEIAQQKRFIERVEQKLEKVNVNLVQQAFPQGFWQVGVFLELEFCLPMDFALIEQFKTFMRLQYPEQSETYEHRSIYEKSAGHFINYTNFKVSFRTERVGSTCVLKQISTEIKTVPIYEVVCAEGADEEAL